MTRDHNEPPVQTLEIRQPHAELVSGAVPGGVVHGELRSIMLERLTDADRGAADDQYARMAYPLMIRVGTVPRMTINR